VTLTIVIVAFNARDDLERCLRSIESAPPAIDHEVIVVDNGSNDGAPEMVDATFAGVRLIRLARNVGFGAANNVAAQASRGELVLLLNPDTVVPRNAIDGLAAELLSHPEAAAIGPRLVDASDRLELSFGPMPGLLGEAWQRALGTALDRRLWPVDRWIAARVRRARAVCWVSGACLLVRRADANAVGWFDERFFLYWEDVDFCTALRARGRQVRFTPAVEVQHVRGRSSLPGHRATSLAYRRGQLDFYRKWKPWWVPILSAYLRARGAHPDELATPAGSH